MEAPRFAPFARKPRGGTRKIPKTLDVEALKRATVVDPPAWVVNTHRGGNGCRDRREEKKTHSQIKGEKLSGEQHHKPYQRRYPDEDKGLNQNMCSVLQ